ncbi:hypothetical protein BJX96DRAFT_150066 [Aspergillus floccosus]
MNESKPFGWLVATIPQNKTSQRIMTPAMDTRVNLPLDQSNHGCKYHPGRRTSPCSVYSITATASRLSPYLPTDNLDGYDSEDSLLISPFSLP